jgi:hypothetical protein
MGYAWHHSHQRRMERDAVLKTYYCPKCQHLRQFYVERGEKEPLVCGKLHQVITDLPDSISTNVSFAYCTGTLLPVVNVERIVPEAPLA